MVNITKKLAHRNNYGALRTASQIKYIVIHYTAVDGDKAVNNATYFQRELPTGQKASAHYFVDDTSIYQSVMDNYVAYSVGGAKYSDVATTGGAKYYGKCTNTNSISIELCDVTKNGTFYPTQKTINNALDLTKSLMKKYNVTADRVIRHFDVNGKHCPVYWMDNKKWESEFHGKLTTNTTQATTTTSSNTAKEVLYRVRKDWSDNKTQLGAFYSLESAKAIVDKNTGYKVYDENGNVVYSNGNTYQGGFPILPPNLRWGSNGLQVQRLQKYLNWYGNYKLNVDGEFGQQTLNALQDFQRKEKLTVDGIFGAKSLEKAKNIKK